MFNIQFFRIAAAHTFSQDTQSAKLIEYNISEKAEII